MGKSYRKFVGNAKYLKKEDIPSSVNTSILWIKEEEVTAPGKGTETRLVLYLDGLKKGLVLNTANAEALAEIAGTDDYEKWSTYLSRYISILTLLSVRRRSEVFEYVKPYQYPYRYQDRNWFSNRSETQTHTKTHYRYRFNPEPVPVLVMVMKLTPKLVPK